MNGPFSANDPAPRLVSEVFDKLLADNPRGGAPPAPLTFIFDGQHSSTPPKMLVKDTVPADGVCFLGGQSGAGKTFIVVNLTVCLASQTPFFGRKVRERVGVAILAAEGAAGLPRRIEAAKIAMDIQHELPIAWCATSNNLLEPAVVRQTIEDLKAIAQQMIDLHGVRLGAVVVDTIGAAFCLQDENDAAQVNAAIRVLRQIGEALGAVVIPVHHYGKAASTGLRGSSAYRGGADAVLSVLAERDEISGESRDRSLCLAKAREGEEGPISAFDLAFLPMGTDEDGDVFGSCIVVQKEGIVKKAQKAANTPKSAKIALAALNDAIGDCGEFPPASNHIPASVKCVTTAQWREYAYRRGIADSDDPDAKRKAFKRAHETLVARGSVAVWEPYAWMA